MARWKVRDEPSPSWFDLRLQSGRRKRPTQGGSGGCGGELSDILVRPRAVSPRARSATTAWAGLHERGGRAPDGLRRTAPRLRRGVRAGGRLHRARRRAEGMAGAAARGAAPVWPTRDRQNPRRARGCGCLWAPAARAAGQWRRGRSRRAVRTAAHDVCSGRGRGRGGNHRTWAGHPCAPLHGRARHALSEAVRRGQQRR